MTSAPRFDVFDRRAEQNAICVLFVGPSLVATKNVFKRGDEGVRCLHANTASDAIDMIGDQAETQPFDCVMVDMRHDADGTPLNVVAIAALRAAGKLIVLAQAKDVEIYQAITGVDAVLAAPVAPLEIIEAIISSAEDNDGSGEPAPAIDEALPSEIMDDVASQVSEPVPEPVVTVGFETSVSKVVEADRKIWQRFVPIANFLYKKLAVIILSVLFLTFVAYGAMIVFFMSSSSWSLPFELSSGHQLVEKTEREIAWMRVRKNEIRQNLTKSTVEMAQARRDRRDGNAQLFLSRQTIAQELQFQENAKLGIESQIARLNKVISDFNSLDGQGGFKKTITGAYARRLITRKALNSGTLAVLETLHRIAMVENDIALKKLELEKVTASIRFLNSLAGQIEGTETRIDDAPASDMVHLARQVIEAKNTISTAEKSLSSARDRSERLGNSLDVISVNLDRLSSTPAARAIKAPVTVLFMPYANRDNYQPGTQLYSCALSIFWCSHVGVAGKPIDGETTSLHPLFGKPLRGIFVEASFENPNSVTEELIHAGGAPLLF